MFFFFPSDTTKGYYIKRIPYVIKPERAGLNCHFPGQIGPMNMTGDGNTTNEQNLAIAINTRCRKINSMKVRILTKNMTTH